MTTLAAVLVRQRTAPLETVEQAMLRQSLFGGDLATNLLELESIDETVLLDAVSTALELAPLPGGPLPALRESLRQVVPANLLDEWGCVPVALDDNGIVVAVSNPLPPATLEELTQRFARPIVLRAALEPRIRQALALHFGLPIAPRTDALLARLDGSATRASNAAPIAVADQPPTSQVPTPRVSAKPARSVSLAPSRSRKGRRLGPFTAAMAEAELSQGTTPAALVNVWLDFVSQYFDYTAIFAVQGDLAAGRVAKGSGTTGEAFARIGVPLDLPSVLETARRSHSFSLLPLAPRGLDVTLARDLGRSSGPQVFVLPITLRNRVVLLTYGDHGSDDVELDQIGDVLAMRPLLERHFERLMVERKRSRSLPPADTRSKAPAANPTSVESGSDKLDTSETQRTAELPAELPTSPSCVPVAGPAELAAAPREDHGESPRSSSAPEEHPRLAVLHGTLDIAEVDDSWDIVQPVVSVGEQPHDNRRTDEPPVAQRASTSPDLAWPNGGTRPGIAPKLELVTEPEPPQPGTDSSTTSPSLDLALPRSRTDSHPARAPQPAAHSTEQALPTVVVDYERDCLSLIERLTGGDYGALEPLIELGDVAISALVRQLPGPITSPSRAPRVDPLVKASECGPIPRALVAFGPAARPYVVARTADSDPKVRAWAIRVLGELGGRPSAMAVAQRIVLDKEPEVRRAAHQSSQLLYRDPDSAQALRHALLEIAIDQKAYVTQRLAAVDALSDLRDVESIPHLVALLADPNPAIAAGARQALVVLIRQDFGHDISQWNDWWNANSQRGRIEWLIDAVGHPQAAIRQAAAEELRLLSRLYVGDLDDDSLDARAKIQQKYRDWWAAGGRSVTSAPKSS